MSTLGLGLAARRAAARRLRRLARWPTLAAALAGGLLAAGAVDVSTRWFCPANSNFFAFAPSGGVAAVVRVEHWDRTLLGFAARTWAWEHLELTDGHAGKHSLLWADRSGEPRAAAPAAALAARYGAGALVDTQPLDERFGVVVQIRAAKFGFPFRSSVRESAAGVVGRRAAEGEAGAFRPATLAVRLRGGAAWAAEPADAERQMVAAGSTSRRDWVLPLGLTGNATVGGAAILAAAGLPLAARDARRVRLGRCIGCGYSLKGIEGARCPECGVDAGG